ncbi:hypothetical protein K440DRAFT_639102 [Wilcoxina mikolae CBS 423.85]|nr:hypothetical protein K440DRAFT_639102 [Wilcoxina mikolae CBS 423.85]
MTFIPVNEGSSTATAIKETVLRSPITVETAGNRSTLIDQALATASRYRKDISPTMIAPDTADSAESPSAELSSADSTPAKLSSAETPPIKLSSAESPPAKLSSTESSPTKPFPTLDLIPELTPQDESKFIHGVYELFADIHEISNAQVAWLSNFEENNAGWRELGYKRYYDYWRTIVSSGWVREMVKQHNTVQKNKNRSTKKLGEYWQQSPELLEILNEGDGSEKLWYTSAEFKEAKALLVKGCPVVNKELNLGKIGLKLYQGLVMPVAYYPFKEDQSRTRTLSPSAPPPNHQIPSASSVLIPSASPVLIASALPTEEEEEEEKLSDFETLTPSESLSSEDSSPEISDIPDTTPDVVTKVVDDITGVVDDVTEIVDDVTEVVDYVIEVVNEDDEATSSDNESSETAVTLTPIRTKASRKRKRAGRPPTLNPTEDKPIDGYDAVVTCSDYMECDVRYTHLVGEVERMISYHHGIYGKHAPLIFERAINREPDVFLTAREQIVSGMMAMWNTIIRAEETLGDASYFLN